MLGLKYEFETAMVNESSVFEPLKLYCNQDTQSNHRNVLNVEFHKATVQLPEGSKGMARLRIPERDISFPNIYQNTNKKIRKEIKIAFEPLKLYCNQDTQSNHRNVLNVEISQGNSATSRRFKRNGKTTDPRKRHFLSEYLSEHKQEN